jgi:hypothetical protein
MLIHPETLKLTAAAGAVSGNSNPLMGICYNVLVKPATSTTTYDISITNGMNIIVFERTSETGTLSEVTMLPMNGIYTVAISNATANELFTVQLVLRDN